MNRSIRGKLIGGALVILLVIVSVLTFVLARSATTLLERESSNQLSQLLEQSTSILSGFLQTMEANLDLWASEPLVHSVANDPALGAIFSLGLRDYFDTHIAKKPWVENIYLLKDGVVVYAQFESPMSSSSESRDETAGLRQLLTLPAEGVTALNLSAVMPNYDQDVIAIKRHLADETGPMDGVFILLLLNLENIQQTLFDQVKAGANGFLTLTARFGLPPDSALWIPAQEAGRQPERADFLALHQQGLLLSESPRRYQSIIIDHRKLMGSPLAVVGVAALRDVREPVSQLIYFAISVGSLAIVAGIVSIFFFVGRLTAPIRKLTAKAHELVSHRLSHGQLQHTSSSTAGAPAVEGRSNTASFKQIVSSDEVGVLASVFQLLDQRTAELEQANILLGKRNRAIHQTMQALLQTHSELVTNLQRLKRELAAARQLQLSMVPSVFPAVTVLQPVDVYALMEPAQEVGGDLYDFFYADEHTFCFLIGDVSDKGTPAALFMARTRSLIRLAVYQWREATGRLPAADQIMQSVNHELCQDNKTRMFVTLFLGLLDIRSGMIQYSNAGHCMPYQLGGQKGTLDAIGNRRPDVPLGVNEHSNYHNRRLRLQSHEMLFLYTDGVPEAMNPAGQFYSEEQLREQLRAVHGTSPKEAIITLKQELDAFVGEAAQFDDVTMLALRWAPLDTTAKH